MCKSVEYIYGYKTSYKNLIGTYERHQQLLRGFSTEQLSKAAAEQMFLFSIYWKPVPEFNC